MTRDADAAPYSDDDFATAKERVKAARDLLPTADLCLGGTSPNKVVHHRGCHHARNDYGWARQFPTWRALTDELVRSGAWEWHRFCRVCCQDGVDAINDAMTRERP